MCIVVSITLLGRLRAEEKIKYIFYASGPSSGQVVITIVNCSPYKSILKQVLSSYLFSFSLDWVFLCTDENVHGKNGHKICMRIFRCKNQLENYNSPSYNLKKNSLIYPLQLKQSNKVSTLVSCETRIK